MWSDLASAHGIRQPDDSSHELAGGRGYYNGYPLPPSVTATVCDAARQGYSAALPIAAAGCVSNTPDPFYDPANVVFSFAAVFETHVNNLW